MLIKQVNKKEIVLMVQKAVGKSKQEILATMLFKEERENPLPNSYHNLLKNKLREGVKIKRLGFGEKVDYTLIKNRLVMPSKNYQFRYTPSISAYQRLLIIDKKNLFFGIDGEFFQSSYKPLIKVFINYFIGVFRKGKS